MNISLISFVIPFAIGVVYIAHAAWRLRQLVLQLQVYKQEEQALQMQFAKRQSYMKVILTLCDSFRTHGAYESRLQTFINLIFDKTGWRAAFWQFDEAGQQLHLHYQKGLSEQYLTTIKQANLTAIPIGGYGSGRAIATKQPVIVNNWQKDPHMKYVESIGEVGMVRSFAAFPIATDEHTYGTLHIYGMEVNQFALSDVQLFTTMANLLAVQLDIDNQTEKEVRS